MTENSMAVLCTPAPRLFTYHAPTPEQIQALQNVRIQAKDLARTIVANCPAGPDRSAAIRKLREAVMTANAAIVMPNGAVSDVAVL